MQRLLLFIGLALAVMPARAQTFVNYRHADGLADDMVSAVAVDSQGNKWFACAGGVSKYDGSNWTTYLNCENSFYVFKGGGTHSIPECSGNRYQLRAWNMVESVAIDAQGNKWFGTDSGVWKFNDTVWIVYSEKDGLVCDMVESIVIDVHGNKWFCTKGGVSCLLLSK